MPDYAGEKSLEPTPHRRQQARQRGTWPRATTWARPSAAGGLGALMTLGGWLVGFLADYCRNQLGGEPWLTVDAACRKPVEHHALGVGRRLLPILGLLCLAGVAVNVLQIGFLFLPQGWPRFRPIARQAAGGGYSPPPAWPNSPSASSSWPRLGRRRGRALSVARGHFGPYRVAAAGPARRNDANPVLDRAEAGRGSAGLAVLDYAYQRWRHKQDLRMTPREFRKEYGTSKATPGHRPPKTGAARGGADRSVAGPH